MDSGSNRELETEISEITQQMSEPTSLRVSANKSKKLKIA